MTLKEGWMYHTPAATGVPWATDPDMAALYKFGYLPQSNSSILNRSDNINAQRISQVGVYNNTIHMGGRANDDFSASFGMINGIPLYWMLGKAEEAADVFTISTMDGSARKPRIGTRQEIDNKNYDTYGLAASRLTLGFGNNMLWSDMSFMGCVDKLDVATTPTYTLPSSVGKPFNHLYSMTWDGASLYPIAFRTEMNQGLVGFRDEDGENEEISEFSEISCSHAMQFKASEVEAAGMVEDYRAKSKKTFTWTVKKAGDTDKYVTCTGDGYLIDQEIVKGYDMNTVYGYAIWVESLTFTVKDGVDKTIGYQIA